jgi:Mrp family chromosome partitioning ATPase
MKLNPGRPLRFEARCDQLTNSVRAAHTSARKAKIVNASDQFGRHRDDDPGVEFGRRLVVHASFVRRVCRICQWHIHPAEVSLMKGEGALCLRARRRPLTVQEKQWRPAREAAKLLPYVDGESGAIASPEDLFDPNLREENVGLPEWIEHKAFRGFVRLVERRIVGQDWLQPPRDPIEGVPPITVFASHKGGVGRSTALAVSAAALSEKGFSVLVVDLDLEAPGLGEMLLNEAPKFGTLDYFVEDGLSNVDDSFFAILHPTFGHHLEEVSKTQFVPQIPAHTENDDLPVEMTALEKFIQA